MIGEGVNAQVICDICIYFNIVTSAQNDGLSVGICLNFSANLSAVIWGMVVSVITSLKASVVLNYFSASQLLLLVITGKAGNWQINGKNGLH